MIAVMVLLVSLLSFSVDVLALDYHTGENEYELVSDDNKTKYVLDSGAVRDETVLTTVIAWRSALAYANVGDTLSFTFSEENSTGYSLGVSVGASLGAAAGVPGFGEVSTEVSSEVSTTFDQTQTFSSSITYTISILNVSQEGFYDLEMLIPTTKIIEINSDWTKYTRTKILGIFWSPWKEDTSWDGQKDELYCTFDITQTSTRPYLDLVKVAENIGNC